MASSGRRWLEAPTRLKAVDWIWRFCGTQLRRLKPENRPFEALQLDALGNSTVVRKSAAGSFTVVSSLDARRYGRAGDRADFPIIVDVGVITRLRLPIDDWLDRRLLVPTDSMPDAYVLLPEGRIGDAGDGKLIKARQLRRAR